MADQTSHTTEQSQNIEQKLNSFLDSFQLVFDHDWDMSKGCLKDENIKFFISDNGTFLDPQVDDESNNWGNRGGLLASYRDLCEALGRPPIQK